MFFVIIDCSWPASNHLFEQRVYEIFRNFTRGMQFLEINRCLAGSLAAGWIKFGKRERGGEGEGGIVSGERN